MAAASTPQPLTINTVPCLERAPLLPSLSQIQQPARCRRLRLLVAANGPKDVAHAQDIAVRLSKDARITTRAIVDSMTHRLVQELVVYSNHVIRTADHPATRRAADVDDTDDIHREACELVNWADLLVLAPIDADSLARMMGGLADTLLLEVLRGWDASKRILLVPGMTTQMWENPVTKRQMSKLHRKWGWVRVLPPILWHYADGPKTKRVVKWDGFNEVCSIIKNQADLLSLGHDVQVAARQDTEPPAGGKARTVLPPEIWSIIFEHAGDWELARAMGVFTNLPTPPRWRLQPEHASNPLSVFQHELEWTLVTCDDKAIFKKLAEAPPNFRDLSALAVHLIFRFSQLGVLSHLEASFPQTLKSLDGKILPTKASSDYGRTDLLDWWARSPAFLEKQYDREALDGASAKGSVHVLEWWRRSGLPLKYSEQALELASGNGRLSVLEWWRQAAAEAAAAAAARDRGHHEDAAATDSRDRGGANNNSTTMVTLKPGRSLLAAAQTGQLAVLRWWEQQSGVAAPPHQDAVCKIASRHGHADVLELWRQLRGDDKLQFDNQILCEPTVHAQVGVLEWWRRYAHGELPGMGGRRGKRVEYKTMDIEEALEDSTGDQLAVRTWWAENGLNLGLGTTEWMKVRYL